MNCWTDSILPINASLKDALVSLERSGKQIALVTFEQKLEGILSDGDIRRALLKGCDFNTPIKNIMNTNFFSVHEGIPPKDILTIMQAKGINQIPVLNDKQEIINLVTIQCLSGLSRKTNPVILMAGGLGLRLRPLTHDCPKPMLKIGSKPILENILESFIEQGFQNFFISVNYLAESIQNYFGNGEQYGIDIHYIKEKTPLGTAGALSLLEDFPTEPFFVMNGDILTKTQFNEMLAFHENHAALGTMAIREYDMQVKYGVVNLKGTEILSLDEKPIQKFFVNAGIYLLSPEVKKFIPTNQYLDMPDLFKKILSETKAAHAYPLKEFWLDIGCIEEFKEANDKWLNLKSETEISTEI